VAKDTTVVLFPIKITLTYTHRDMPLPVCRFSFLLSGLVRLTWAFVLVLIDLSGGLFSVICPFLRTGWPSPVSREGWVVGGLGLIQHMGVRQRRVHASLPLP
jgi:hypothetical protein